MIYTVENTWKELHEARVETAIVLFGAIEQHGHHLPLGTDWIIADGMGRALAEALGENGLLLPAMLFDNSHEGAGEYCAVGVTGVQDWAFDSSKSSQGES